MTPTLHGEANWTGESAYSNTIYHMRQAGTKTEVKPLPQTSNQMTDNDSAMKPKTDRQISII
jgi:hypothetical protein